MRYGLLIAILVVFAMGLHPLEAPAQITNGDFSAGGLGWTTSGTGLIVVTFKASGGNPGGYVRLEIEPPTPKTRAQACVLQTFPCGAEGSGTCQIQFDYRTQDANSSVYVDSDLKHSGGPFDTAWSTVFFEVDCGTHTIELCADATNNGARVDYDNVIATCVIETGIPPGPGEARHVDWGTLKTLFR